MTQALARIKPCQGYFFEFKYTRHLGDIQEAMMEKVVNQEKTKKGFLITVSRYGKPIERLTVVDLGQFARLMMERRKQEPTLSYRVRP